MLQVLPVNDMATGQTSPYSALSAMAIEPLYIAIDDVPDVQALGEAAFPTGALARRAATQCLARGAVRRGRWRSRKWRCAAPSITSTTTEWADDTPRAQGACARTWTEEHWWLDDYALFRVLHDHHDARPWWDWPAGLAARERGQR